MEIVNTIGKNDTQMLAKLSELLGSSLYREDIIAPSSRKFDLTTQLEPTAKTCVGKKSFKKIIYSGVKNSLLRDTSVTVAGAAEGDERDCSNSSRAISFKSWQSKVTVAGSKSSSSAANNAAKESEKWSKFLDRVDEKERQKSRDVKRERQRLAVKESEECFFSPNLSTKSLKIAASFECLRDRMPGILSAREGFLQQQRADLLEREKAECTFSPHRLSADCGDFYLSNPLCSFLPSSDYRPYLEGKRRKEEELRRELLCRGAEEFTFQPKTSALQYLSASKERRRRATKMQHSFSHTGEAVSVSDQRMTTAHDNEQEQEFEGCVGPDSRPISNSKLNSEMAVELDGLGLYINTKYSQRESSGNIAIKVFSGRERHVGEDVSVHASPRDRDRSKCPPSYMSDDGEGGGDDYSNRESSMDGDGDISREGSPLDTTRFGKNFRYSLSSSSSSSGGSKEVELKGSAIPKNTDTEERAAREVHTENVRACDVPMSAKLIPKRRDTGGSSGSSSVAKVNMDSRADADQGVERAVGEEKEGAHRHGHAHGRQHGHAHGHGEERISSRGAHGRKNEHNYDHEEEEVHVPVWKGSSSEACKRLYRDGLVRVANRGKRNDAHTSTSLSSTSSKNKKENHHSASMKTNKMTLTQTSFSSFHASNQRAAYRELKMLRYRMQEKEKRKEKGSDTVGDGERETGSGVGVAEQDDEDGDGDVEGVDPSDVFVAVVDCNSMRERGGEGYEKVGERVTHMRLHQLWLDLLHC